MINNIYTITDLKLRLQKAIDSLDKMIGGRPVSIKNKHQIRFCLKNRDIVSMKIIIGDYFGEEDE